MIRYNLMLSSRLGLSKKMKELPPSFILVTRPAHLKLIDLIILGILGE